MPGPEDVRARVVEAIEDHGSIRFDEYMELALYAPGGFFDAPPVGETRHFVTSPHVHPLFGKLLANGLRQVWGLLDRPDPFPIVEAGAGDGTFARQLLEALEDVPVAYTAVERSRGARAALEERGLFVVGDLSASEPIERGVVLANELLDNLPFRRVRGTEDGPVEVHVGLADERLVEVEMPPGDDIETKPAVGDEIAVPVGAFAFVDELADALGDGYALLIDYEGGTNDVHGYREHRVVEIDVDAPGTTDITAGVDLQAVARHAEARGFRSFGTVSQTDALRTLGFEEWFLAERDRQTSLLSSGSGIEAVQTWSGKNAAMELVDPAGLGTLRWLTLATDGRPKPPWNR
ncbi:MAG: SAM-dependent methyltransferase [Actinomycetota bacterium]